MKKESYLRKAASGMGCVLLMVSAVMLQIPGTVGAQEDEYVLEDTIVTATKTGETLIQETPLALTVFDDEALKSSHMFRLTELDDFMPNTIIHLFASVSQVFIRGVGSPISGGSGGEVNIGFYVDGIYIEKGLGAKSAYFDVERIEVLRGPQGTLYGRNTPGGAINIITKAPSDELEINAGFELGSYSKRRVDLSISGPLIKEKLNARFTVSDSQRDGYVNNLNGPDGNDENYTGFRGRLDFRPTDRVEIQLSGDYSQRREAMVGSKLVGDRGLLGQLWVPVLGFTHDQVFLSDFWTQNLSHDGHDDHTVWGVSVKMNIELPHEMNFRSITSYREHLIDMAWDVDYSILPLADIAIIAENESWSQELQLDAKWDRWDWVLGLYYYNNIESHIQYGYLGQIPLPPPFYPQEQWSDSLMDTSAWALYGQATYALTDKLSATAGLRYSRDSKDGWRYARWAFHLPPAFVTNPEPVPLSGEWSGYTPKLGLDYQMTDDALFYASAARGWKSGMFFTGNVYPRDVNIEPETIWTYEIGAKTDWLGKRLRANLAAFYSDYKNQQITQMLEGRQQLIQGDGEIRGVELELTARPFQGLTLNGSLSHLDTEYTDLQFDKEGIGNPLAYSPEWNLALQAEYTTPVADYGYVTFRGAFSWSDEYIFDPTKPWNTQEAYSLVNASIRFETAEGRWSVEAYGTNLTEEEYVEYMYDAMIQGDQVNLPGVPRMFGLQVVFNY